jgi:hypothetical protein
MINNFPEVFDEEFDDFLVGEGSTKLLKRNSGRFILQLDDQDYIEEFDDTNKFVKVIKKISKEEIEKVFLSVKKDIYKRFDYLRIKSLEYGSKKVRLKDILVSDFDKNLIEYLEDTVDDHYAVVNISKLCCFREFGFDKVFFKELDGCELCESFDGSFYDLEYLFDLFSSGSYLTHKYCECDFIPLIDRKNYKGNLRIDKDMVYNGVKIKNYPVEYGNIILDLVSNLKGVDEMTFEYLEDHVVLKEEGKKVIIDMSYTGFYNAIDYLESWMYEPEVEEEVEFVDPSELEGEVFLWKGREVVEYGGKFIDIDTNQVIDELSEISEDLKE